MSDPSSSVTSVDSTPELARWIPVEPESAEFVSGMEVFLTDTPPIGGKLRVRAEDFCVEELGPPPRRVADGKHVAVRLTLTDWEHNHFIRDATRRIGISRNVVGFAGMKDKRAVTTQWMTFLADRRTDEEVVAALSSMRRVEVHDSLRTHKMLRLGMHEGNRFKIRIRRVPGEMEEVKAHIDRAMGTLDHIGGFPNFFGIQRFGSVRPITHIVGKHLVHGNLEEAMITYVTAPGKNESEEIQQARKLVSEDRDWKGAVDVLPTTLRFERAVVQHLAGKPDDVVGAVRQLPANLLSLFVHSYQSYLFNQMLSERIRRGLPLHRAVEGDIVFIADQGLPPSRPTAVPVTAARLEKVNRQMAKGRAVVTGPLYGVDTDLAEGVPGEIEQAVLDAAGVRAEMFHVDVLPEAASKGLRRALLTPAREFGWEVSADDPTWRPEPDDDGDGEGAAHGETSVDGGEASESTGERGDLAVTLRFALPRGAYATTLLREIMKAVDTTQY